MQSSKLIQIDISWIFSHHRSPRSHSCSHSSATYHRVSFRVLTRGSFRHCFSRSWRTGLGIWILWRCHFVTLTLCHFDTLTSPKGLNFCALAHPRSIWGKSVLLEPSNLVEVNPWQKPSVWWSAWRTWIVSRIESFRVISSHFESFQCGSSTIF